MTLPNSFSPSRLGPDPRRSAESEQRRENMRNALDALSNALAGGERTPIQSLLPATGSALTAGAEPALGPESSDELAGLVGSQPTTGDEVEPGVLTLEDQLAAQGIDAPSGSELRDTSGLPTHADVVAAASGLINGKIPQDKLVSISGANPGNRGGILLAPAAKSWDAMIRAAASDGVRLFHGDTYRSWERQNSAYQAYRRGERGPGIIVAPPGTSKHGAGLAVDVTDGKGIIGRGSSQWQWLAQNGARFGWYGISSESWHWEYRGT